MKSQKWIYAFLFGAMIFSKSFAACTCATGINTTKCNDLNTKWISITENSNLKEEYLAGTCRIEQDFHPGGTPPKNCAIKSAQHITVEKRINGSTVGRYHVFKATYTIKSTKKRVSCTSGPFP